MATQKSATEQSHHHHSCGRMDNECACKQPMWRAGAAAIGGVGPCGACGLDHVGHVGHVQVKQALPASTHCASSWQSVRTMARTLPEFRMAPWTTPCSHQKLHVNSQQHVARR